MPKLLIALLVAAALAGGLYALGVFDGNSDEPETTGTADGGGNDDGRADGGDASPGGDDRGPGGAGLAQRPPPKAPDVTAARLSTPAGILVLAPRPTTWTQFVVDQLPHVTERFLVWYTVTTTRARVRGEPDEPPGAGESGGLPALTATPDAALIASGDIAVLIVDQVDPRGFSEAFWKAVRDQVNAGSLGLWIRPGYPSSVPAEGKDQVRSVHPILEHEILASLLPIAKADAVEGSPLPGALKPDGLFQVTEAGMRHPATRFQPWPKYSAEAWDAQRSGEHAWKTNFCYPVTALAPGATALTKVEATGLDTIPALIAGASAKGQRVLWQGNIDFGHKAYYQPLMLGIWVSHALVWLAGQAE